MKKDSIRIENNLIEQNYFLLFYYFIKIHIFPTITISSVRIEIYITIYHIFTIIFTITIYHRIS